MYIAAVLELFLHVEKQQNNTVCLVTSKGLKALIDHEDKHTSSFDNKASYMYVHVAVHIVDSM